MSPKKSNFPNLIHIWARDARMSVKDNRIMADKMVIKLSFNSVPVEIHYEELYEAERIINPAFIKQTIQLYLEQGFSAPVSWNKTGDDVMGKYGQVVKIEAADKMFAITAKLDGIEKEFVWKAFTATEFRKGDYIKVVKNDRGYKAGQLVTPEEYTGQKELADAPRGKDDIPF